MVAFYVLVLLSFLLCPCPFMCLTPTLSSILSQMYISLLTFIPYIDICCDGLGVRLEDLYSRGQWFESPLEQFLLKTMAVNSVLGNRNMIGKIPTWWENSVRRNRKTVGKIPPWWEISLSGRKKVFRCMDHLVLRHPSYVRGFTYPFSLSVLSSTPFPQKKKHINIFICGIPSIDADT